MKAITYYEKHKEYLTAVNSDGSPDIKKRNQAIGSIVAELIIEALTDHTIEEGKPTEGRYPRSFWSHVRSQNQKWNVIVDILEARDGVTIGKNAIYYVIKNELRNTVYKRATNGNFEIAEGIDLLV